MPKLQSRASREAEIPTSSMADIAFLLLIFFLVTTTIDVDTGIGMVLPPELDDEQEPPKLKERNLLNILINATDDVLVEGEFTDVAGIRDIVKKHVSNNGADPDFAESPDKAIVSFKTERETSYDTYIRVLDEIRMGYKELRDAESLRQGFQNYAMLKEKWDAGGEPGKDPVAEKYPLKISIAEPASK